jgi:type II secretory pathway component PulK
MEQPGGGDDEPFDRVDELDSVAYVERSALEKLRAFAAAHP